MLVSRKYIEQYFNLENYTNDAIAEALTTSGFEVEGVIAYDFKNKLVVGEVLTCEKHPDSDHLHICTVDVAIEQLQIVCGAKNVAVGQKVIVALVGCELPQLKITKSKVRGIESSGMLCSLVELGVPESTLTDEQKNGIEILKSDAIIGDIANKYIGLDDVIFELGVTPNRSDVVALNNLLKELAAIFNQQINIEIPTVTTNLIDTPLKVACSENRYISAQKIENITIKDSSEHIQSLLKTYNIKSINNIVDISNYVALLTGQPNHIYDAEFVKGSLRIVDDYEGEFVALDGNTYNIVKGDLMIFDDEKPLGIAGIMGGEYSKVTENTKNVIIEVANFERMKIRNTSRRLNITSESSIKYQKNIDPQASDYASRYIVDLLIKEADAKNVYNKIESSQKQINLTTLKLDYQRLNNHLGSHFSKEEVFSVMKRLDFEIKNDEITIPSYRSDITVAEDLYEEVIRLLGYDHLPTTLPTVSASNKSLPLIQKMQRNISQFLNKNGIQQAMTYTLISDELNSFALNVKEDAISLASPLSDDRKIIRRSILPSLLEVLAYNESRSVENCSLYEISDVTDKESSENRLSIVLSGNKYANKWNNHVVTNDFYVMKSLITQMLVQLGYDKQRIVYQANTNQSLMHPYQCVDVYIGRDFIGTFGTIHPTISKKFIVSKCVLAELNLTKLESLKVGKIKYTPVSRYQSVKRDIAILVDKSVTYGAIKSVIEKTGKSLIKSLEVFDIYEGENIGSDKKSMAIRITLQSQTETLDNHTIQSLMENITTTLTTQLNAQIR